MEQIQSFLALHQLVALVQAHLQAAQVTFPVATEVQVAAQVELQLLAVQVVRLPVIKALMVALT
jgi:predicted secreted protein